MDAEIQRRRSSGPGGGVGDGGSKEAQLQREGETEEMHQMEGEMHGGL